MGRLLAGGSVIGKAAAFLIPPLKGEGRRALSAFTRVFDALWRAGVGERSDRPPPGRSLRSRPPSPATGGGIRSQIAPSTGKASRARDNASRACAASAAITRLSVSTESKLC